MMDQELQFLDVGEHGKPRKIAVIASAAEPAAGRAGAVAKPGLVWLPGLKSDMISTKATALAAFAREHGHAMTRFDYSGHGRSSGAFEDATIGDWLAEARAVFTTMTSGPQILVGSSTGGYVALLLLRDLLRSAPEAARRITALVLIAPAWDLTEELMWRQFPAEARRDILERGVYHRPSAYGEAYAITRQFIEEGRNHLFAGQPFDPGRPVVILQGVMDVDVPVDHARRLAGFLSGGWAKLIEVADGEHRMSRPEDLELLYREITKLAPL
ncbi:MAG: alpha/beta hydrolase [Hyphomicrobiaceae bacterium]|nr:alpha/beta hydrolase [Hyphomicrobiaceae bacterium]